jgi:hypothetical protein
LPEKSPGFIEIVMLYGSLVAAWFMTELGRTAVAGAAGGIVRSFTLKSRRILDFVGSSFFGAICAIYVSPFVLKVLEIGLGEFEQSRAVDQMAAFFVGLGGMSLAKLFLTIIDAHARKVGGPADE